MTTQVELTEAGGASIAVEVAGKKVSTHSAAHTAIARAVNEALAGALDVQVVTTSRVRVKVKGAAPLPVPSPPPAPEPPQPNPPNPPAPAPPAPSPPAPAPAPAPPVPAPPPAPVPSPPTGPGPQYVSTDPALRAPDVVWVQEMTRATEVTAGTVPGDPKATALPPRHYVDASGVGWLQATVLGAVLAADYTAGDPTMRLVELDEDWAAAIDAGTLYAMACRANPTDAAPGDKNLFRVTGRDGNTIHVQYSQEGYPFAPTPQSYKAGDWIGQEAKTQYRRLFSALPAGENGLPWDDPAAGGAVPVRSFRAGNARSVPVDERIGYGYYVHPANDPAPAPWVPWIGARDLLPRHKPVDGHGFCLRFITRIGRGFFDRHAQPDPHAYPVTRYWGQKFWSLMTDVSCIHQILTGIAPDGRFGTPDSNTNPATLVTHKATRVIGLDDGPRAHKSAQPGGLWDVPPYHANITRGELPASGQATPNGSACYEHEPEVEVCHLVRVVPGRSGVAETVIEWHVAHPQTADYDGKWTCVLKTHDSTIIYGSGYGDEYPDGPLDRSKTHVMDTMPGWNAFWLMRYLNISQDPVTPPPRHSFSLFMREIIFSRGPWIDPPPAKSGAPVPAPPPAPVPSPPAPAPAPVPSWTPKRDAAGLVLASEIQAMPLMQWRTLAGPLSRIADVLELPHYPKYPLGPGGPDLINNWCGGTFDEVSKSILMSASGHGGGSAADNAIYEFSLPRMQAGRPVNRSAYNTPLTYSDGDVRGDWTQLRDGNPDVPGERGGPAEPWTSHGNLPLKDGRPGGAHTFYGLRWIPPQYGAAMGLAPSARGYMAYMSNCSAIYNLQTGECSVPNFQPYSDEMYVGYWFETANGKPRLIGYKGSYNWRRMALDERQRTLWQDCINVRTGQPIPADPQAPSHGRYLPAIQADSTYDVAFDKPWPYSKAMHSQVKARRELVVIYGDQQARVLRAGALLDELDEREAAGWVFEAYKHKRWVSGFIRDARLVGPGAADFNNAQFVVDPVRAFSDGGLAHDPAADVLWAVPNDPVPGGGLYRISGLAGDEWHVDRYDVPVPVKASNGTYGRWDVCELHGALIGARITAMNDPVQVIRLR